jgi:hypothetical protein
MEMKSLRPLFAFVAFVLLVGMACQFSGGNTPAPQPPTQPPTQAPTQPPPPTQEAEPTALPTPTEPPAPTNTPEPVRSKFFTEEFDQDPGPDWVIDIVGPGADLYKSTVSTEFKNSRMRVELPNQDLYFYYTFTGFSYDNVRIDLRADNRGVNSNNISLVCRLSEDGWYEWSVGSDGLWYLYAMTNGYNVLTNGGSNLVKMGKEVNEYTMICKDKTIAMFINGKEIKQSPFTDNRYVLREGNVGFNISSINVTPVIVEVDWFKISEP